MYEGEHDENEGAGASEPIARLKSFAASEMLACESCARPNPPNRTNCIYCGATLPGGLVARGFEIPKEADDDSPKSAIFITPDQLHMLSDDACLDLARLCNAKREDVKGAISAGGPFPVASASANQQAKLVEELDALGLRASIFSQKDLAGASVRKIRGLDLREDCLSPRPSESSVDLVGWGEIALIVVGRYFTTQIEVDEKRTRKQTIMTDSRQFSADESALDLHLNSGELWRIRADNFDYTCLENRAQTVFENFARLLNLFRARVPQVEIDESYLRKRVLLAKVWPLDEEDRNSVSFARTRKFKQSTTVTNESQFANYSRAAFLMKTERSERLK